MSLDKCIVLFDFWLSLLDNVQYSIIFKYLESQNSLMRVYLSIIISLLLVATSCSYNDVHSKQSDSSFSTITCPYCGFSEKVELPTEYCQIKYTCSECDSTLLPEGDDCCVFCTHGDHKCPSKQ